MDQEQYRGDLAAAHVRIGQLEEELATFRADPAIERVDIAEERLAAAKARFAKVQKLLPRAVIGSFVLIAAFAITGTDLPEIVQTIAYVIFALGVMAAIGTSIALLRLRFSNLPELERQVRIAKGDVGTRQLLGLARENTPLLEAQNKTPDPIYGTIS